MSFIEDLRRFAERTEAMKGNISTEEATKTSLIMPFFKFLDMTSLTQMNLLLNTLLM